MSDRMRSVLARMGKCYAPGHAVPDPGYAAYTGRCAITAQSMVAAALPDMLLISPEQAAELSAHFNLKTRSF